MNRKLVLLNKKIMCAFFIFSIIHKIPLFAQNDPSSNLLRFPLWFVIEEAPSVSTPRAPDEKIHANAVQNIKILAPFLIEGLVYGWRFSYTPSDKLRGVSEYFEMEPVITINPNDVALNYTDVRLSKDTKNLECWIEYNLTERMIAERKRWESGSYPRIQGQGADSIFNGTDGIKKACELALKSAVRNYARTLIKNKPKEIQGTVLLTDFPHYYIDSGKYTIDLDFFLFVSRIVEYTQF